MVGLNSDASVRRLNGAGRPLVPEAGRAAMLAGLRSVDAVTLFDEDTPLELIRALLPDVLVKGGDYDLDGIVRPPTRSKRPAAMFACSPSWRATRPQTS